MDASAEALPTRQPRELFALMPTASVIRLHARFPSMHIQCALGNGHASCSLARLATSVAVISHGEIIAYVCALFHAPCGSCKSHGDFGAGRSQSEQADGKSTPACPVCASAYAALASAFAPSSCFAGKSISHICSMVLLTALINAFGVTVSVSTG